jgi:IS30 family transposase
VVGRPPKPFEVRELFWQARADGVRPLQAGAIAGVSRAAVRKWVKSSGGVRPRAPRPRSPLRLSLAEREEISRGLAAGWSFAAIGRELGRPTSTISREVARNGDRRNYRAGRADRLAVARAVRPKPAKLAVSPRLRAQVEADLAARWSPQQISARLRVQFPDEPEMRVSHETVYTSLFVQSRGTLRQELTGFLRTGRAVRRPQGRAADGRGQIPGMVMISERPAEADDRAVPGHWEGDLIVGRNGKSHIGTLVERTTRFVMLLHLPDGPGTETVTAALTAKILQLPVELRRSVTWDQGREMYFHRRFTVDTGVQVYFCDPHSPWQRGSNENTNGLLRQYFPKSTDLSVHPAEHLDAVARELNGRPRQTLGWKTPWEALNELVAMTA